MFMLNNVSVQANGNFYDIYDLYEINDFYDIYENWISPVDSDSYEDRALAITNSKREAGLEG